MFSLSNTVVQATINGFGSAAIAGSAATLNFEYYTYFFVNAFGQTAVTFTGQNFAAKNADRCRAIFRWCVLFGFTSSLILGVTFTALGTRALGLFTTDAAALSFGLVRLWFVELPDCLTTFYEVPAAPCGAWLVHPAGGHHHPRFLRAARGAGDLGVPAFGHLGHPYGDLSGHLVVHDRGHARLLFHRAPPLLPVY